MKQNMVETILGGIVLIVAVIFFIYGTGQANIGSSSGGYNVTAQFTDIGGLAVGDDVKIAGVTVGRVSDIDLNQVTYDANVTLSLQQGIEIPYDTSARVSSEGLLGGTYMALDVGGDSDILAEGDAIAITQSAQNLEQLLGKFIFSMQEDGESDNE
jgi:phospholipid/cholesterol/gamma-HCH transport system substrate-binding protein